MQCPVCCQVLSRRIHVLSSNLFICPIINTIIVVSQTVHSILSYILNKLDDILAFFWADTLSII